MRRLAASPVDANASALEVHLESFGEELADAVALLATTQRNQLPESTNDKLERCVRRQRNNASGIKFVAETLCTESRDKRSSSLKIVVLTSFT